MLSDTTTFLGLILSTILVLGFTFYLLNIKKRTQLQVAFIFNCILSLIWSLGLLAQIVLSPMYNIDPIKFENIVYIAACFFPISLLFIGVIFANTKIKFRWRYCLLFIIPIISLIVLWTNDAHHLFYEKYSINVSETVFGSYFAVYSIYSYLCIGIGLYYLISYTIKNSGFFSKQSLLIIIGTLIPVIVNILGYLGILNLTIYITPLTYILTLLLYALAIFKFNLFNTAPIALQRIVDRMSDSYIIVNSDNIITDFNKTFLTTFKLKAKDVRNINIFEFIKKEKIDFIGIKKLEKAINDVKNSSKTISFEKEVPEFNRYFHIEINSISSNDSFLGTLILFKDTTQHMLDMQTIKDNQDMLMEKERLASLGQLIGGIAHNLKTPIMSIAGAAEGINDLIKEYDSSIGDPEVTNQDHHDIAKDMSVWVEKIKQYTEYMSDVITAVKGQAVVMSEQDTYTFTIDELVKRVDILMKHELKNALIELVTSVEIDGNTELKGNINSLVQVINNMISNAIQAYNGKTNEKIFLTISKEKNKIIVAIKDKAGGLPKEVTNKLFKEMITTKGKNGTGLGLFMSYSNIRAHFNGNIIVESTPGVGTEFKIILPI